MEKRTPQEAGWPLHPGWRRAASRNSIRRRHDRGATQASAPSAGLPSRPRRRDIRRARGSNQPGVDDLSLGAGRRQLAHVDFEQVALPFLETLTLQLGDALGPGLVPREIGLCRTAFQVDGVLNLGEDLVAGKALLGEPLVQVASAMRPRPSPCGAARDIQEQGSLGDGPSNARAARCSWTR